MSQWFLHDPSANRRLGPMDADAARAEAARNPSLLAWKEGMGDWLPVRNIAELYDAAPGGVAGAPPPPPRNGGKGRSDEIDFKIHGQEMQFVEIELDPGESAIAEAGALMFKDSRGADGHRVRRRLGLAARPAASWTSCCRPASA